jgi:hypothetical protein
MVNLKTADASRTEVNEENEEKGLDPTCWVWTLHLPGDRRTPNPALVTTSFFVTFVSFCSEQPPDLG